MTRNPMHVLCFVLSLLLVSPFISADVIVPNTHQVDVCAKVTNLEHYPSIVIIAQDTGPSGGPGDISIVQSGECMPSKSYKFDSLKFYWADKSYVDSVGLSNLKQIDSASQDSSSINDVNVHFISSSIRTSSYSTDNSNPITHEDIDYTLAQNAAGQFELKNANGGPISNVYNQSNSSNSSSNSIITRPGDLVSEMYLFAVLVLGAAAIIILYRSLTKPAEGSGLGASASKQKTSPKKKGL